MDDRSPLSVLIKNSRVVWSGARNQLLSIDSFCEMIDNVGLQILGRYYVDSTAYTVLNYFTTNS